MILKIKFNKDFPGNKEKKVSLKVNKENEVKISESINKYQEKFKWGFYIQKKKI